MKTYLTENRFKFLGWTTILIVGITLGFMARPGFDKFSLAFEDKPYVAPKSDNEQAVDDYFQSVDYQAECRANAQARVMLKISGDALEVSKQAQLKAQQYEIRALNGISSATATETIKLEKAQGRRP